MRRTVAFGLVLTALAALSVPSALAQTPQDVLNKMIEAMGGRKALQAIKDTTITGSVSIAQFGITADITMYQKEPNKMRMEIAIPQAGMTIVQAFDGQKGWYTNPQTGAVEEMPEFMAKDMSHQALGNTAFLEPAKIGVTYALKPKTRIGDKDFIVLEQTLADGHKITFALDPTTYLPYRTTMKALDQSGAEVDAVSYSEDYRKVGGTMLAHSLRVLQNGAEFMTLTVASVSYNTNLDDALFKMK